MAEASSRAPDDTGIFDEFPGLAHALRWVFAVLTAAFLGTGFWLFLMQEGHTGRVFNRKWTDHDFPDGLGNALGAVDPARTGLVATFVIAIAVVLLFALVEPRLPGRDWRKGLAFAPVIFLLWGLVFCPLVDGRQILQPDGEYAYPPSGLFGSASGWSAAGSAVVASLVTGLAIARAFQLCRSTRWWHPADTSREFVVDRGAGALLELPEPPERTTPLGQTGLLELAEERAEQRGERTG